MIYINTHKPQNFGDLKAGDDYVYLIDPNSARIVKTKVRSTRVLKSNGRVSVLELKIYKLTAFESVTDEKMELAKEEYNTKIDWTIRVFNTTTLGKVSIPGVGVPTIISADKTQLELWMKDTGPKRKKIIL